MKRILSALSLIGILILALSCREGCLDRESDDAEVVKTPDPGSFPPAGTVEVRAFSDFGAIRFLVDGEVNPAIKKEDGILLRQELQEELWTALNTPHKHWFNFVCWSPRDALVCYDHEGKVVGAVVICFTCYKARISPASLRKELNFGKLARVFSHPDLLGGYPFEKEGVDAYAREYEETSINVLARRAQDLGRTVTPEAWKVAEPRDDVIIRPGDEVCVSSALYLDELDVKAKVDREGLLKLKYCTNSVRIGGMTEVQASKVIRDLYLEEEIYHPETEIKAVKANRFPEKD